jgi:methylmalonyl-CoA mutase
LHTNSFDEAIAMPTEFSARIARNTQLVIQEETGITHVIDPWGGSYFMERLTQDIAERAWELIEEIESHGGMARAIETGLPKLRIEEAAAKRQARIERRDDVIVGVNKYQLDRETEGAFRSIDLDVVRETQTRALARVRASRDPAAAQRALAALSAAAREGSGNLLELAVDAARVRCTVGEISDALERVWGRYSAASKSVSGVYGAAFEKDEDWKLLQRDLAQFRDAQGRGPRMLVAKIGQDGHDRGAKLIATAFADLGFDIDLSPMFSTPEEVAAQAVENDVHVVGVSSLAAGHNALVPELLRALAAQGAGDILVVVGGVIPKQDYRSLQDAGVTAIFGPGTPVLAAARDILGKIASALRG